MKYVISCDYTGSCDIEKQLHLFAQYWFAIFLKLICIIHEKIYPNSDASFLLSK